MRVLIVSLSGGAGERRVRRDLRVQEVRLSRRVIVVAAVSREMEQTGTRESAGVGGRRGVIAAKLPVIQFRRRQNWGQFFPQLAGEIDELPHLMLPAAGRYKLGN